MAGLGVGLPAHSVVDAAPEWPSGVVAGGEVERPHEDRLELGMGSGCVCRCGRGREPECRRRRKNGEGSERGEQRGVAHLGCWRRAVLGGLGEVGMWVGLF